ncbi:DUF551 domain-containing protein [Enterobacter cloacae subsp. dissolvens]
MDWVSVADRLPKNSVPFKKYIVFTQYGVGFADYDHLEGFRFIFLSGSKQYSCAKVSHWMELPKAPPV